IEVEEEEDNKFWNGISHHTPEDRIAIAEKAMKIEEKKNKPFTTEEKPKLMTKLFASDGRPYNINQPKVAFTLNDEDNRDNIILDVAVYRYLDTSYLDVDVQPRYVRVTIKGKVLQLTLPCEVQIDNSSVKRNVVTGHLMVTMPRVNSLNVISKPESRRESVSKKAITKKVVQAGLTMTKRELLEIGPPKDDMDFSKIIDNKLKQLQAKNNETEEEIDESFIDNPEVPPLE
ncbi:protein tilB homolog, partial [Orussus abietinus]|uniref:protein tilB homolog n=1 Tax=Orussus abietinus TaxID=222816 RepID=UPI000C7160E0